MASQRWQIPSFVPAREPGHTPRLLLSSTPWFSAILGQSGDSGATTRGAVAVLGRLAMVRTTQEPHSCVTGAPTAMGHRVSRSAPRRAAGHALRLTLSVVTHDHGTPAQARLDWETHEPTPSSSHARARQAPRKALWQSWMTRKP